MLKMVTTACIEAPVDKTWCVLADIENVDLWVDPILSASCDGGPNKGVGASRTCQLKGNVQITEMWTEWNDGKSFTYVSYDVPMAKFAKNKWSVEEINGKTLLKSEAEIVFKGGIFGRLLEPMMSLISKKMGSDSMAGIKHLVETGEPYQGKVSNLPRAALTC
ncbi:MAG: SRPBCC family protein [Rhizobiales bacterium]|nr:SRPBCC family protein [Hyphomicrobiales bacterium]